MGVRPSPSVSEGGGFRGVWALTGAVSFWRPTFPVAPKVRTSTIGGILIALHEGEGV